MWQNKHSQRQVATIRLSLILYVKKTKQCVSESDQFKYLSHHNIHIHFVDQDAYHQSGVKCHKLISPIRRIVLHGRWQRHGQTIDILAIDITASDSASTVNPNRMERNWLIVCVFFSSAKINTIWRNCCAMRFIFAHTRFIDFDGASKCMLGTQTPDENGCSYVKLGWKRDDDSVIDDACVHLWLFRTGPSENTCATAMHIKIVFLIFFYGISKFNLRVFKEDTRAHAQTTIVFPILKCLIFYF